MLASLFSGAVAAAAVTAGYQSMGARRPVVWQYVHWVGPGIEAASPSHTTMGPNDPHTLRLLEVSGQAQCEKLLSF